MIVDWERVFEDLLARISGPLHLRLFMQPAMALVLGIRDGLKDSSQNKPAYMWSIFTMPGHRLELLKAGLKSVAKVLIAAILLDATYQMIALHWFYPGEAILVALTLAFVPYLFIRGPTNRIAKMWASLRASRRNSYPSNMMNARTSRTTRNQH